MSDLVGNPEDRFSQNEAQMGNEKEQKRHGSRRVNERKKGNQLVKGQKQEEDGILYNITIIQVREMLHK